MSNAMLPARWGKEITSKDYELLMLGDNPVEKPISLLGHELTNPNQTLSDPVTVDDVMLVRGKIRKITKTLRAGEQTQMQWTIGFPSASWTPALAKARAEGGCEVTLMSKLLCPTSSEEAHVRIMPNAVMNPPAPADSLITISDDIVLRETTTVTFSYERILWQLGASLLIDHTHPLYAAEFFAQNCVGCTGEVYQDMFAVGAGAAAAAPSALGTENRFAASVSATGFANDLILTDVLTDDSRVIVSHRDNASVTTATTGGIYISNDSGATFTAVSGIATPINALAKFNQVYLAAGGVAAGAKLFWSTDGSTWTEVTGSGIPTAAPFTDIAGDSEGGFFYAVSNNAKLVKFNFTGSSVLISDITAKLPTVVPASLTAVAVLAKNHIAVGGASGYYAESRNAGVSFTKPSTFSGTVLSIAGDVFRTLVGVGTSILERSALTNYQFSRVSTVNGYTITGNITNIKMGYQDFNYFLVTTSNGEVLLLKPFYPQA